MKRRILGTMKATLLIALGFVVGCSSPTAPTPPPPAIVTPPVAVVPPVVTPPVANPLLSDPRFSRAFFDQFAHNALESPNARQPLRRQTQAPRIYMRTVDDAGAAIDALTLNQTAAAVESTTGKLTGSFGIAALERGTDTRESQPGWITIRWSALVDPNRACGRAAVGGNLITLYPKSSNCRCAGGPAVALRAVKHELGHALGFWHTDARSDLMYVETTTCDQEPSAREIFHGPVVYSMPVGSLDP